MADNEILEELYAIRRQIMIEQGDDLTGYLHTEFERLKATGHPIADFKQRRVTRLTTAPSPEAPMEDEASSPGDR